jgi:hypothetical protein
MHTSPRMSPHRRRSPIAPLGILTLVLVAVATFGIGSVVAAHSLPMQTATGRIAVAPDAAEQQPAHPRGGGVARYDGNDPTASATPAPSTTGAPGPTATRAARAPQGATAKGTGAATGSGTGTSPASVGQQAATGDADPTDTASPDGTGAGSTAATGAGAGTGSARSGHGIRCPIGFYAVADDGVNDTACLFDVCRGVVLPNIFFPQCDHPFRPW